MDGLLGTFTAETVKAIRDGHLDFHTAPELCTEGCCKPMLGVGLKACPDCRVWNSDYSHLCSGTRRRYDRYVCL